MLIAEIFCSDECRRFLRARRFQLDPAFDQFNGTEKWRKENRLTELYETIDVEAYEETRRLVSDSCSHWHVCAKPMLMSSTHSG